MTWLRRLILDLMCGLSLRLSFVVWEALGYNLALHQLSGPPGNRQGSTDAIWLASHLIRLHRLDIRRTNSSTPRADWLLILSPSRWTPLPMQAKSGKPGAGAGVDTSGILFTSKAPTPKISYDNIKSDIIKPDPVDS